VDDGSLAGGRGAAHEGRRLTAFEATTITTGRLVLVPLAVDDAADLAPVLANERLHEFTGGRPLDRIALRHRYARLVAGPSRPNELWRNWIVRLRSDGAALGTVQATLTRPDDDTPWEAEVAWTIGVAAQGEGHGSEAASGLVDWLVGAGASDVVAHIHPDHRASAAVAQRAGLAPTYEPLVDGERVWRLSERAS
jgi:RimJ/RimL family protein N-acetyltransferase